jgi:hypothetical protein
VVVYIVWWCIYCGGVYSKEVYILLWCIYCGGVYSVVVYIVWWCIQCGEQDRKEGKLHQPSPRITRR